VPGVASGLSHVRLLDREGPVGAVVPAQRSLPPSRAPGAPAPSPTPGAAGRLPGLDGLRGLAVAAVVAYHLDSSWLPGGFLGVDLFFVLSGFLITRNLVAEHIATGGIRLGRFWLRRARRLLPALGAVLAGILAGSLLVWRDQLPSLGGGMPAVATYTTNWWLTVRHTSYFAAAGRPSMLQHLWSLAIRGAVLPRLAAGRRGRAARARVGAGAGGPAGRRLHAARRCVDGVDGPAGDRG